MIETLLDPFHYAFFVKGVLVATLAGGLCGLIGVYITLRGMSYIGHGLSHAIFGGFAASAIIGLNFYLGAGLWGLVSALAINRVTRRRIGADAAIGVITTASFALGVALLTIFGNKGPSFDAALFGSIIGITATDVWVLVAVTVFTAAVITIKYRALLFATFDPEVADVSGVRVARLDALLMLVLSLAILATLTVIGVTLVAATLVIPAVIARMITNRFSRMLWLSTAIGTTCGFVGMNLSYHLNVPSGTTIVLTSAALFTVVLALTGGRLQRTGRGAGRAAPAPPRGPDRRRVAPLAPVTGADQHGRRPAHLTREGSSTPDR
jgi:manganese/iron transport system permease protein/iron/zinc/copper transport system permease protein